MERQQRMVMIIIWLLLNHGSPMPVSSALFKAECFVPAPGNSSVCIATASVEDCAIFCETMKDDICEVFRFYDGSGQCIVARMKDTAQCCCQPEDGGKSYKKVTILQLFIQIFFFNIYISFLFKIN